MEDDDQDMLFFSAVISAVKDELPILQMQIDEDMGCKRPRPSKQWRHRRFWDVLPGADKRYSSLGLKTEYVRTAGRANAFYKSI